MKWIALNALGGLIWLAGLAFAKGVTLSDTVLPIGDHRVLAGMAFGLMGLLLLLWANLRSTA